MPARPELLKDIVKRHKLEDYIQDGGRLRLDSPQAAAAAAGGLLLDGEVARIRVHPAVKDFMERRGTKALYRILKLLPESKLRDSLILKIPGPAYANTESADVAAILSLLSPRDKTEALAEAASESYDNLPQAAWQKLAALDAFDLVKKWSGLGFVDAPTAVMLHWLKSHSPYLGRTEAGAEDLGKMLSQLAPTTNRDRLIQQIPIAAYAEMSSAAVADILSLISPQQRTASSNYQMVPAEAWRKISRLDVERLANRWRVLQFDATAAAIVQIWLYYQADSLTPTENIAGLLRLLEPSKARDDMILAIPNKAYFKLDHVQITDILALLGGGQEKDSQNAHLYGLIPDPAWQRLLKADIRRLMQQWMALDYQETAGAILRCWLDACAKEVNLNLEKEFKEMLNLLPRSGTRNELILRILGSAYAKLEREDMLAILSLLEDLSIDEVRSKIPAEAWNKIAEDAQRLLRPNNKLTEKAQFNDTIRMLGLLTGANRTNLVLAMKSDLVEMSNEQIVQVLSRIEYGGRDVDGAYELIPFEVYKKLSRADIERLLQHLKEKERKGNSGGEIREYKKAQSAILRHWIAAHQP
ncbi:MAG: hypothetical protein PHF00_04350, partial [Elusimicrobia bacterium]|nr:hypothetical protein [Elusimicrobiota bacterium]